MTHKKQPIASQVIISDFLLSHNLEYENSSIYKALTKLLVGDYSSDFEKLTEFSSLYSMRLEGAGRILLTKLIIRGVSTLVLLECLFKHEYEESKCFRYTPLQWDNRVRKCAEGFLYVLDEQGSSLQRFETAAASASAASASETVHLIEHRGAYLDASDAQRLALAVRASSKTQIVYGEAGSGKTLVLMEQLAQLAMHCVTNSLPGKIWVLIPHLSLCESLKLQWKAHSVCREIELMQRTRAGLVNPVHILSPDSFYRQLDGLPEAQLSTDHREFLTWLSRDDLASMHQFFGTLSPLQIYQELCLFNGLVILQGSVEGAKKIYESPELRQVTLVAQDKKRVAIVLANLLQRYQAHLSANNGFDAYLYQPQNSFAAEDYFIVDEAQNLPPGLLKMPNARIAMNDSQSIRFKRRLNEMLLAGLHRGELNYTELPGSHRSPKQVVKLAARIDALAALFNPKRKQASTSSPLKAKNPDDGVVCLVEECTADEVATVKSMSEESDNTAVVYLTADAQKYFARLGIKPLCAFTVDNPILGLEFKRVIVVSPFDSSLARTHRTSLSAQHELDANAVSALELYLNTVKAAMTRSTDTLVLFQPKAHETAALMEFVKKDVLLSSLQAVELPASERQALLHEQACRLYQEGQHEMALGIIEHLQQDQEQFLRQMRPEKSHSQVLTPQQSVVGTIIKAEHETPVASAQKKSDTPTAIALPEPSSITINLMRPLSKELEDYVEKLYNQCSEANLYRLLKHPRAAFMLFHHKMNNGYCFFVNLFWDEKPKALLKILEQTSLPEVQNLIAAIAFIPEQEYFLRLILSMAFHSKNMNDTIRSKMLTFEQVKRMGLGCLFVDGKVQQQLIKVPFLLEHFSRSLNADDLLNHAFKDDGSFGPSFLNVLSRDGGLWGDFFRSKQVAFLKLVLKTALAEPLSPNYCNVILELLHHYQGRIWVNDSMQIIAPMVNARLLYQYSPHLFVDRRGGRFADWLCAFGFEHLKKYWSFFKPHFSQEVLYPSIEGLGQPVLNYLLQYDNTCDFARENWSLFRGGLNYKLFSTQIVVGELALVTLTEHASGLCLIAEHFEDFKPYLNEERLFGSVHNTLALPLQPFCRLIRSEVGQVLLIRQWDFFQTYVGCSDLMDHVGVYIELTTVAFYLLLQKENGLAWFRENNAEIKNKVLIDALFLEAGYGPFKGKTAYSLFSASSQGQELLSLLGLEPNDKRIPTNLKIQATQAPAVVALGVFAHKKQEETPSALTQVLVPSAY